MDSKQLVKHIICYYRGRSNKVESVMHSFKKKFKKNSKNDADFHDFVKI
jgi:hypothetical protein